MYGMVNEGVRTFVRDNFGDKAWNAICARAAVEPQQFDRMHTYPDAITYSLVEAVADHAGLSSEEVLRIFGGYWVSYAGGSGFGNLLKLAGNSFIERVRNLDDMHERIQMTMAGLKPPSFELTESGDRSYELAYYSARPGLAPMVIGLLHGLAEETGETISVEHVTARKEQDDPDIFAIRIIE